MKIAISTDKGQVSAHFGRCPEFTIVEVNNNVVSKELIPNPGHHPGFLPKFLKENGVGVIIAGGMGQRAQALFAEQQIKTVVGVAGRVADVVNDYLTGSIKGGQSLCQPGDGKGYGVQKSECNHDHEEEGNK
ncbi:MAG: NifB/NifX family molybdenum-iron cluster-binding protein [bacterium]|nr:NifB/NifX family molybdenum-iron cluster-binding protein [Candidatus Margulisiibacteriota bacterium]